MRVVVVEGVVVVGPLGPVEGPWVVVVVVDLEVVVVVVLLVVDVEVVVGTAEHPV